MNNITAHKVRERAKKQQVYLWQIAERLGISEATMTRKLRNISDADAETFVTAIDEIRKERKGDE